MKSKSISSTCGLLVFALSMGACAPQKVGSKKNTSPSVVGSESTATEQNPEIGAETSETIEVVLTDKTTEEVIESLTQVPAESKGGFGDLRMAEARHAAETSAAKPVGMGELRVAEARDDKARLAKAYKSKFYQSEIMNDKIEFGLNFWGTVGAVAATTILAQKAEKISFALSRVSDDFASVMSRMPDDFQERINNLNTLANEANDAQKALHSAKANVSVSGQTYAQVEKVYLDAQSEFDRLSRATSNPQTLLNLGQDVDNAMTKLNQFKSQITTAQMTEIRTAERVAQNAISAFESADKALLMRVTRRIEAIGNGVADVFNKRASRLRSMEGAAKVQRIIVTGGSILVVAGVGKIIYDIGFDDDSVVIHAKVIEELKKDNPGYETVIDSLKLGAQ
jgi:hypothetical protein